MRSRERLACRARSDTQTQLHAHATQPRRDRDAGPAVGWSLAGGAVLLTGCHARSADRRRPRGRARRHGGTRGDHAGAAHLYEAGRRATQRRGARPALQLAAARRLAGGRARAPRRRACCAASAAPLDAEQTPAPAQLEADIELANRGSRSSAWQLISAIADAGCSRRATYYQSRIGTSPSRQRARSTRCARRSLPSASSSARNARSCAAGCSASSRRRVIAA